MIMGQNNKSKIKCQSIASQFNSTTGYHLRKKPTKCSHIWIQAILTSKPWTDARIKNIVLLPFLKYNLLRIIILRLGEMGQIKIYNNT